jgi:hypothetical protein
MKLGADGVKRYQNAKFRKKDYRENKTWAAAAKPIGAPG